MPSPTRPVVRVSVPAKINLWLSVGPLRADGFHELQTVFHAVDLCDDVIASAAAQQSLTVTGITDGVPTGPENIAWRAVGMLAAEAGVEPAVRLRIHKRIPVAGGMAGGSADAAGALLACNALWGHPMPSSRLAELAMQLGSDVGFPLVGGTALGVGRGEVIAPLTCPPLHWAIVPAPYGISAGSAYAELDRLRATDAAESAWPVSLYEALTSLATATEAVQGTVGLLRNDLAPAALSLRPELAETLRADERAAVRIVSGSGPTCAFLYDSRADAEAAAARLRRRFPGAVAASGPVTPKVCVP